MVTEESDLYDKARFQALKQETQEEGIKLIKATLVLGMVSVERVVNDL